MFIHGCLVQSLDTCEATADATAAQRSIGLLDTAFAIQYDCPLLIGNQLNPQGNQATLRTETARILIYAADVQLLDAGGNLITRSDGSSASFTVPTSGEVDPGSSSAPGFGIADVVIVDAATAFDLGSVACGTNVQQDVVANIVVRGRTLGGDDIESGPFNFPVRVCYNCTCVEPFGDSCTSPTTAPAANCRVGLDNPSDCRFPREYCSQILLDAGCKYDGLQRVDWIVRRAAPKLSGDVHDRQREADEIELGGDDDRRLAVRGEPIADLAEQAEREA